MSEEYKDETVVVPEIVVIKRKRGGEEGHHGGVWKIAYADFMTAMMAFFLVMWLINASNEETKAQVASYFNPVKLVDSSTNPRGLNDKKSKDSTTKKKTKKKKPKAGTIDLDNTSDNEKSESKKTVKTKPDKEEQLLQNPIKVLNEIAAGALEAAKNAESRRKQAAIEHEYRDPFAPKSWQVLDVKAKPKPTKRQAKTQTKHGKEIEPKPKAKQAKTTTQTRVNPPKVKVDRKGKTSTQEKNRKLEAKKPAMKVTQKSAEQKVKQERFEKLKKEIYQQTKNVDTKVQPSVEVRNTKEGVLISLTDKTEFGMFNVASAKPTKELVLFMEKIAKIIANKKARLVIRGHTDGRPFHSKKYDNWRLSTARAQIARFMLVRGGIPETRFARIVGYADRKLLLPQKPFDARNRRIEILLLEEKS